VRWARQAGFTNLNLDLIFGLPEQLIKSLKGCLRLALDLEPEHFSLYALTLEKDTVLERWVRRGLISEPEADLAADMYECAAEMLNTYSYAQYEISNWARFREETPREPPSFSHSYACRHNLQYWRNLPYLGFGAGAHGYINKFRTANVASPLAYIQQLSTFNRKGSGKHTHTIKIQNQLHKSNGLDVEFPVTPATQDLLPIDLATEIAETMMMGLRLTEEGVSQAVFHQRFGCTMQKTFGAQIERLTNMGLLEWSGKNQESVRLTPKGRLLGNRVFVEFL